MRLTLRMRITLLTGIIIVIATLLLTSVSIYTAQNKISQAVGKVAAMKIIENPKPIAPMEVTRIAIDATPLESIEVGEVRFLPLQQAEQAVTFTRLRAYTVPASEASKQFNATSVICMGIVSLIGMAIAYYMAGKALKPVHNLNQAILKISEDNLKERLTYDGRNDEIGVLTKSFNEMLDRLEESFWRQKRFSSSAAHELKTPLATMKTGIQVLELFADPSADEYREMMNITSKHINRLSHVVDDLLILTNQGYEQELVPISIESVLNNITEELEPLLKAKEITIESLGSCEGLSIMGNETLTYRLFYNLIENAIKYNVHQGKIQLAFMHLLSSEVGIDGKDVKVDKISVKVADTGTGIAPEEQDKIFEAFYCVNPSRSRKLGGAGLGLSIVQDIAERYGWRLEVKSAKGEGSVFEVVMPVGHVNSKKHDDSL